MPLQSLVYRRPIGVTVLDVWSARTKPLARRTLRVYSLIRRWTLERLTVARYDDVNMNSDVSSISMSINNGILAQLLSTNVLIENASDRDSAPPLKLCLEAFPIKTSE